MILFVKRKLYSTILKMMLKDSVKLLLTGKQKSQVEALIDKCERRR